MKEVVYSPQSQMDIDDIWDSTADRWNVEQADAYTEQIRNICLDLADGLVDGRNAEDIRSGYRKRAAGSHLIFYEESPEAIQVLRILHQRMDWPSHVD